LTLSLNLDLDLLPLLADWARANYPVPKRCGAMEGCGGNMLAAWALGITGICLGDSHGIRIGQNGAKVGIMRVSTRALMG
jgi:hypothetical protein